MEHNLREVKKPQTSAFEATIRTLGYLLYMEATVCEVWQQRVQRTLAFLFESVIKQPLS